MVQIGRKIADTDYMNLSFGRIAAAFLLSLAGGFLGAQVLDLQEYLEPLPDDGVEAGVAADAGAAERGGLPPSFELSTSLPPLLAGLWENNHRIVSFESLESAQVVLKLFYGWYYDRAAEPGSATVMETSLSTTQVDYDYSGTSQEEFAARNSVTITEEALQVEELPPRPRNDATSAEAQRLLVEFQPLIPETETSGAWNIWITYPGTRVREAIPVAVFDGRLYVDFFLAKDLSPARFYQAASNTQGITISPPLLDGEVASYLVTGSRMYRIRYWQTDMDYDGATQAVLTGEDGSHDVPKHLLIGGTVYTCVAGRRVDIRNVEEVPLDLSGFTFSGDNRIAVREDSYLSRMDADASQLYQLIAEANSRQAPPPPPPIPLGDLDFHYDQISDLRKYMIPQPVFPEFEAVEFIKTESQQSF